MAKKRRTAAQKAATRKMIAANRARRKGGKKSASSKKRRRRANPVPALSSSPRRKRRSSRPVYKATRRRRKNPSFRLGSMTRLIQPALVGSAGAIGLDILMGYAPIPVTLKTGPFRYLVKAAGALAVGFAASLLPFTRKYGEQMAVGALTCVGHDAIREGLQTYAPTVQLGDLNPYMSGLSYYSPGYIPAPADNGTEMDGMGEYITTRTVNGLDPFMPGVGEYETMPGYEMSGMGAYLNG